MGEDQINDGPLPQSLARQGNVNLTLVGDGITVNTTNLTFQ